MSELLRALNKVALIEKLDGDDERFTKIEEAATNLAEVFRENPSNLIRAVLAGLDPEIPLDDPAIIQAEEALVNVWASMRSVHIDQPLFIYRSILLDACDQVAEGKSAAILWYTAADALPLVRLGKEEKAVRAILASWALKAEQFALIAPELIDGKRAPGVKKLNLEALESVEALKVNRANLKARVEAASGPSNRDGQVIESDKSNRQWPNSGAPWSYDFSDYMTSTLSIQFNSVYKNIADAQNGLRTAINSHNESNAKTISEVLSSQRSWLQGTVNQAEQSRRSEHLRLNTLWWCEALYSPSLQCSYRELDPALAVALMPIDLLDATQTPVPASVAYTLSEAVNKLPEMSFGQKYDIVKLLAKLGAKRDMVSDDWVGKIFQPPKSGRFSLRDLVISVLLGDDINLNDLISRTGLDQGFEISLPDLAKAILRQEQAVLLAETDGE